jgi:hypothetical protein
MSKIICKITSGTDLDVEWGTASSGLTLINTTSFSGVASHSVNNVFTSTYTNYRIVISGKNDTATNVLRMRLRASGTDNTSSNYIFSAFICASTNASGLVNSTGTTFWYLSEMYRRTSIVSIDITNPFATDYTTFHAQGYGGDSGTGQNASTGGGSTTVTTSYDGFTIFPDANTITGTVRVYGYNQ